MSPEGKHMRVNQEETDMAAWVEQQVTEASAQLEYIYYRSPSFRRPGLDGRRE